MAETIKTINDRQLVDVGAVRSINNILPDENGNVTLPIYNGEYEYVTVNNTDTESSSTENE